MAAWFVVMLWRLHIGHLQGSAVASSHGEAVSAWSVTGCQSGHRGCRMCKRSRVKPSNAERRSEAAGISASPTLRTGHANEPTNKAERALVPMVCDYHVDFLWRHDGRVHCG